MRGFFNQTDQIADPRRSLTAIRFYERFAITKHRLSRIYHHLDDVIDLYLKRWREKDWDEKEERDTTEFLELEKEIYKEMYPHNADVFNEDDEETDQIGEAKKSSKKKEGIVTIDSGSEKGVMVDVSEDEDDDNESCSE